MRLHVSDRISVRFPYEEPIRTLEQEFTDFTLKTLALSILSLRIQDCFRKISVELKRITSLLNFNTNKENVSARD